jgi:anti-sigma factor RsiW
LKAGLEMKETPDCERASDLIAFLYNEADERERRDFQLHLNECSTCRQEVASFGVVRESITAWRDEALAGFVSQPVATNRKSALAALRQFFDLSPLWLKGATAFAVVTFCVLAAMVFVNLQTEKVQIPPTTSKAIYTQDEADRMVEEAIAKQQSVKPPIETPRALDVVESPTPKKSRQSGASHFAKSRRPLSRSEREQLAADLRLISNDDDLQLIGDRINQ